jgi:hypothetical protein
VESYQKVFTARKMAGEDKKQYAVRLNQYAAEAGSVLTEDGLISAFVDDLHPYASNTVSGQVTSTMMFARCISWQKRPVPRRLHSHISLEILPGWGKPQ